MLRELKSDCDARLKQTSQGSFFLFSLLLFLNSHSRAVAVVVDFSSEKEQLINDVSRLQSQILGLTK
jgi:hypothetical protein